jgi:O-methyltransferase
MVYSRAYMSLAALRPVIDRMLKRRGARIAPIYERERMFSLIGELEGSYRDHVFPNVPPDPTRLELLRELQGTSIPEAMYIVAGLHDSKAISGDVCEFGIAQGATSALLANEIRDTDKRLWLFDSFSGLPKPTAKDRLIHDIFNLGSMEAYEGKMAVDICEVKKRLEAIAYPPGRVSIVPGFIEETISLPELPKLVSFAYVDFDLYEPISIALAFLSARMPTGSRIVVDDYGWFSEGAQIAVDEFFTEQAGIFDLRLPVPSAGHFAILNKLH